MNTAKTHTPGGIPLSVLAGLHPAAALVARPPARDLRQAREGSADMSDHLSPREVLTAREELVLVADKYGSREPALKEEDTDNNPHEKTPFWLGVINKRKAGRNVHF